MISVKTGIIVAVAAILLARCFDLSRPGDRVACQDYHYRYGQNKYWRGDTCEVFSGSYHVARQRFRDACPGHNNNTVALPVVVRPGHAITYTMDVCVVPGPAPGLVVHVSGTHGVEGYAGSAIQVAYLTNLRRRRDNSKMMTEGVEGEDPTVVFIHAYNPYGMAHYRRGNENNVDLNRNGLSDAEWSTFAVQHWNYESFERLRPFFAPTLVGLYFWPSVIKVVALAVLSIAKYGIPTLKEAMVGGQYHDPSGIFYGGTKREASYDVLDKWLQSFLPSHTTPNDVLTLVDVHTGLGQSGEDTLLAMPNAFNRLEMCPWFQGSHCSADDVAAVDQGYDKVRGGLIDHVRQTHFAAAAHTKQSLLFVQEFGTIPLTLVGLAVILENAAHRQGLDWALRTTRHAFYPQSPEWRIKTLQNGLRVIQQAKDRSRQLSAVAQTVE